MRKALIGLAMLLGVAVLAVGCGQKASSDQPMEQVKAEAQTMSVDQLVEKAKAYKAEIAKVQAQLADLAAQAKKYVSDPLSEGARNLASRTKDATGTLDNLKARLQVYLDELTKKGQDVSKLLAE